MQQTTVTGQSRAIVIAVDRVAHWLSRYWLALFIVVYGAWVLTPFLAPVLGQVGAREPANAIYFFYSFFCHQLPERSLFLFGPKLMYSYVELKGVWPLDGFVGLRQFVGNSAMGYKVAWSDRMISFYGSIWLGALLFALLYARIKPLSARVWLLVGILPVSVDGMSHAFNDVLAGTSGAGFRDTNVWLQGLTGNIFPQWFYQGDALGSFNSDMRWITGILFGLTTVWFLFPHIEQAMGSLRIQTAAQLERARARL